MKKKLFLFFLLIHTAARKCILISLKTVISLLTTCICYVSGLMPVVFGDNQGNGRLCCGGVGMFSLQRKLKNSVCNYILKYVADNNDQSRDQGVSKFVGTRAS